MSKSKSETQIDVAVQNAEGREVDRIRFDAAKLDSRCRATLIKEAVVMYRANQRSGTHETKTRSKIAGSNRKPWRQKGTGRARAGTRKSPLWRGGGIIFGPHPRDYGYQINKKQRRRALRSALFAKFRAGDVKVVDRIELDKPSTKTVATLLRQLGVDGRALIGTEAVDRTVWLSARNIEGVKTLPVGDFNALDVLHADTVVLTRPALEKLLESGAPAAAAAADPGGES